MFKKHYSLLFCYSLLPSNAQDYTDTWGEDLASRLKLKGFIEGRFGYRLQDQDYQRGTSMAETRLQTDLEYTGDNIKGKLVTDFIYDNVMEHTEQDFENGDGYIDLREANIGFKPTENINVTAGRQILNWGVTELAPINNLFPKD
jgi:hypothetical protein